MSGFWWRSLLTVALLAVFPLILWPIAGAAPARIVFGILLLLYLLLHLRNLKALAEWLQKPDVGTVPHGSGLWEPVFAALYQLVRKQSDSQHNLSSALERFLLAGEAMPDGIVMLNSSGQIEWCNPVAEVQFGIKLERDRGQWMNYLIRQTQFTDYLAAHNYREPLIFRPTRNRELALSIQLIPFGDEQKLLISRDITQIERVETMRRDFVANVSHELSTPLTVIGGFLETLTDMEHLDETQTRHHLNLMLDQATRMQHLVKDLLALSKLESTHTAHREEKIDMPRLMRDLLSDAQSLSAGRHHLQLDLATKRSLLGNEDELRSAFGNLVSNAIRYTPEGGEIKLQWEEWEGEGVFSVQDSGIGIEPQHIARLTERFYRVDRSRSRETGGTGLGLAIAKHALTRHQARLEIESAPGKGSTFSACFSARRLIEV
ncbi:MAG: phosphate regulon sensor histidine kinase PhoR [Betaproteobacteria bacterium]|nr:phosphate regulon sensor histidine kinase PhoR [Betaproteobacteria bacterium]